VFAWLLLLLLLLIFFIYPFGGSRRRSFGKCRCLWPLCLARSPQLKKVFQLPGPFECLSLCVLGVTCVFV
jgi:hypothetical protein